MANSGEYDVDFIETVFESLNQCFKAYKRVKGVKLKQPNPYEAMMKLATGDEIKEFYKAIAKRLHPDHGGSADKMRLLNAAYEAVKAGKKTD